MPDPDVEVAPNPNEPAPFAPPPADPPPPPAGTPESDDKPKALVVGGGLIAGGLALTGVLTSAIVDSLDSVGAVDRRIEAARFLFVLVGAVSAGLGTNVVLKAIKPQWKWWSQLLGAFVVFGLVVGVTAWFFVDRPDSEIVEGELTADNPFDQRVIISGGNGHRYFITLERSGTLQARLALHGTGSPIEGVAQDDGRITAEGVLLGDTTWTVLLSYIEGSGKYRLFVDSAGPESLSMQEEPLTRGFDQGRSRAGYVFSLDRPSSVYLRVESANSQSATPAMLLRDSDGTPIDNVPIGGDGLIFTRVQAGDYVLAVSGNENQQFGLTFNDTEPESGESAPDVPERVDVDVPDVYGESEQTALSELTDAGFVVQAVPVCSNSMAAEGAEVGTTRQVVLSGAASIGDEVEVVGSTGVQIARLETGTALDAKVFNGLPCDTPRLGPDEKMYVGDRLSTGRHVLEMTADRGLVAFSQDGGDVWFESDVERPPTAAGVAIMQASDGNLVLYDFDPQPESIVPPDRVAWASGVTNSPGAYLSLAEVEGVGVLEVLDASGELVRRLASSNGR